MQKDQRARTILPEPAAAEPWYTYMVRCADGTLYAGIAKDVDKRLRAHNQGRDGARYTRSRRPVTLVYQEAFASRSDAARREHQLKKMPRELKQKLVAGAPRDIFPGTTHR